MPSQNPSGVLRDAIANEATASQAVEAMIEKLRAFTKLLDNWEKLGLHGLAPSGKIRACSPLVTIPIDYADAPCPEQIDLAIERWRLAVAEVRRAEAQW
jgi:hypothetical protein